MYQKAKGLFFIPVIQPIDGEICGKIGYVAGNSFSFAIFYEVRVVIMSLAGKDVVIIKARKMKITFFVLFTKSIFDRN